MSELPQAYQEFIPKGHFLRPRRLQWVEEKALPDIYHYIVTVSEGKRLRSAAYFQILTIQNKHLDVKSLSAFQQCLWYSIKNIAKPKLCVAGHLFHHEIQTFYTTTQDVRLAFSDYRSMMDAALHKSCAVALLVKDMPSDMVSLSQDVLRGFELLRNDISMELKIRSGWKNILDYEKSLKHKYAQRFRKIYAQRANMEVVCLESGDVELYKEEIHRLYMQVATQQQVRLGFLNADYIPMLKANYPDKFFVYLIRIDGEAVAFFSYWLLESTLDMYYIGFDYARNAQYALYFNLLYLGIELAIESSCNKVYFGRTALDAKSRLGCEPKHLSTYLYIKNAWVRRWVSTMMQRNVDDPMSISHHPFKN